MSESENRFKALLRELFQFARADLNFGIYRVMNEKRARLDAFIDSEIVRAVDTALKAENLGKIAAGAKNAVLAFIRSQLEAQQDTPFDSGGNLTPDAKKTKAGKAWLAMQGGGGQSGADAPPAGGEAAIKQAAFNALYTFFSRYYDDGDFICKQRYAAGGRYAVPYGGEEVLLHWANKDQYYIKTAEYFPRYEYKLADGVKARFEMRAARLESDNNKSGEKKYFIPLADSLRPPARGDNAYILPFAYRPLTAEEKQAHGDGKADTQGKIIESALSLLRADARAAALFAGGAAGGECPLSRHMSRYIKRNTADFFIHKNLRGFLSAELDYYINRELLNRAELLRNNANTRARMATANAVYAAGTLTIDFLAQLEDFQKRIWEKKKFITATEYVITLAGVQDTALLQEAAANDAQWREWRALGFIPKAQEAALAGKGAAAKKRLAFMRAHPSLTLDTAHFSADFKARWLGAVADLDGVTDGVLFHSENWQALNLLQEKYRGRIDCVHIDPPYNTATSGFLYKNDYKHSSWLAMMENRISDSLPLLSRDGVFQCHIDENENSNLAMLFSGMTEKLIETVVWDKTHPLGGSGKISTQHEYIIVFRNANINLLKKRELAGKVIGKWAALFKKHKAINEAVTTEFAEWLRKGNFKDGEEQFRHLDEIGPYQTVHMGAPEQRTDKKFFKPLYHPVTKKACPVPASGWSNTPEFMASLIAQDAICFGEDETVQPRRKVYLKDSTVTELSTIISDGSKGKKDLSRLGLLFSYCHPKSLYEKLIFSISAGEASNGCYILDHFAGSGTTAHAVINLNREDGGKRKFILAEMGEYFNTVLLPRIKKVTFSPEWTDGKPKRPAAPEEAARAPRVVKYHRIESYDDALDNIRFDDETGKPMLDFPDYAPRYMLRHESRASATFADATAPFRRPFNYALRKADDTAAACADLPETFAYLIGMREKTRRTLHNGKRRYVVQTGEAAGESVAVIWRDTKGWKKADFEKDRAFVAKHKLTEGAARIYVNDDSAIPGAQSLTPVFAAQMFPEDEDE